MTNDELKKKIAQIIAEYCCRSGKTHKQLYGDDRICYSKMNFAECNPITECTDALIAAGIGDVKEVEKEYSNAMLMAVKSQTISSERSRYMELNKSIAEHHAVVAERAFKRFCEVMAGRNCHAIGTINPHTLADTMYEKFCAIAEKELAEERKE